MIAVKTSRPLSNGMERRRYEITVTDLLGDTHAEVLGMFNHESSNDGSEVEASFLLAKKEQEIEFYEDEITEGRNPFMNYDLRWNSKAEALKAVLDDALSLPATDSLVLNGVAFINLATDDELMTIYEQNQEWVDTVRTKAAALAEAKTTLDNYEAVL